MSWLRIDDGFSRHPKVTALTHRERWTWLDVLCYCASYQTGGYLPEGIGGIVPGATTKFLGRCGELGLVNVVGDRLRVHDWHVYNGTIGDRVAHYLDENPDATANEVHKAVGGTRELVLIEVKRVKESGSARTSKPGSARTGFSGSESGSESGSRAGGPSPLLISPKAVGHGKDPDARGAAPERPSDLQIRETINDSLREAS